MSCDREGPPGVGVTAAVHWSPDPHLIESALAGNLDSRTLTGPDRAWVVAGLAARGVTAEGTARLLGCSLRTVRTVRAEPMTVVCTFAMAVTGELEDARGAHRSEVRRLRFAIEDQAANADRYRGQRDELVAAIAAGTAGLLRCGHPNARYNVHRRADGSRRCRECDRRRSTGYRRSDRTTPQVEGTTP